MNKKLVYCFDIDGVLCTNTFGDYRNAEPNYGRIKFINKLYDEGHTIIYWTARGSTTGKNWEGLTKQQLKLWGAKCHKLIFGKVYYDIYVDDKAFNSEIWFKDKLTNKFPEYQSPRHTLAEKERICECGFMMKCIEFSSHPVGDQVWMDWKCNKCDKVLKLRYYCARQEEGTVEVTLREEDTL